MMNILLLGASGSIGTQTIDIINEHQDELNLVGVSVGKNTEYLKELLSKFKLKYAYSIYRDEELIKKYPDTTFYCGEDGLCEIVKNNDYDMLVNALVGFIGFMPTLNAIKNHKDIALANKETLVAGGDIIMQAIKDYNVKLYPIDSEHSAIFQCLQGNYKKDVNKLIITASGGAFRDLKKEDLQNVTVDDALKHPTWSMGKKITVDCATMMNKGFEIIEAHYLFDIDYDRIEPIIHTQSIVHSMVEYKDGSILAQLSSPDMRLPIRYALLYPNHLNDNCVKLLDLIKNNTLTFKEVDYNRYPLVKLAKEVGKKAGNLGAVLNSANDTAVNLFIENKIKYLDIEKLVIACLNDAEYIKDVTPEILVQSYKWAENYVLDKAGIKC